MESVVDFDFEVDMEDDKYPNNLIQSNLDYPDLDYPDFSIIRTCYSNSNFFMNIYNYRKEIKTNIVPPTLIYNLLMFFWYLLLCIS